MARVWIGFRRRFVGQSKVRRESERGERVGKGMQEINRCAWAQNDPQMREYHDREWGVPEFDSRALWELLMLEGFQAGLSWITVLRKREAFRRAFAEFDPEMVAQFGEQDVARLMGDAGIIRAKAKIEATIRGAQIFLEMRESGMEFGTWAWGLMGGKPLRNTGVLPAQTPLSEKVSKELKLKGFKFVGPVIVYAWMQAAGMVDDHAEDCFRRVK
jgi:DNA-3-methyladenine glycosylase I